MNKITIKIPVALLVAFSSMLIFAVIFGSFIQNKPLAALLSIFFGGVVGIGHILLEKTEVKFPKSGKFLGISKFAFRRHFINTKGRSYTVFSPEDLIELVEANFHLAIPGDGEKDLTRKVVVPIPEELHKYFHCPTIKLKKGMKLKSKVSQRQKDEDLYVSTFTRSTFFDNYKPESPKDVKIVCYSSEALLENNGERSTDANWEIVAIICSAEKDEPMYSLTMARNFLQKPGGTYSEYTAKEFAESIYYWSQRVNVGD